MKLSYAISVTPTRFEAVARPQDARESIRQLAALGFDGVELAIRDPAHVDIDGLAALVRTLGLAVPAVGTGQAYLEEGLCLTAADPTIRERAVARLLAQVDAARRLDALVIVGLIHGPVPPGTDRDTAAARTLEGLGHVARAAREVGVRLVLEPINRYESNWLNTVDEVMDLIGRLGEDNVGVLPDTFHMNIEEADLPGALRRGGSLVWHVHVADSNRRAPGTGHLDVAALVAGLRGLGYTGYVSAEILQHPTAEQAARRTIEAMRPLVGPASPLKPRRDAP